MSNTTRAVKIVIAGKNSYPFMNMGCQRESSEPAYALASLHSAEKGIIAEYSMFLAS